MAQDFDLQDSTCPLFTDQIFSTEHGLRDYQQLNFRLNSNTQNIMSYQYNVARVSFWISFEARISTLKSVVKKFWRRWSTTPLPPEKRTTFWQCQLWVQRIQSASLEITLWDMLKRPHSSALRTWMCSFTACLIVISTLYAHLVLWSFRRNPFFCRLKSPVFIVVFCRCLACEFACAGREQRSMMQRLAEL